jgi:hypothetical protein
MIESAVGIPVIDAHAHFMTRSTVQSIIQDSQSIAKIRERVSSHTDMKEFQMPDEDWDIGEAWIEDLNKYGITAIGMMVGEESWDEFNQVRDRYPGRFMGNANINPANKNAIDLVKRAGRDNFQAIKLYPTSWDFHAYDEIVYPIYEEALKQGLLVMLHFGITIGSTANLRFGNPLDIQKPAHDFPDLNFMIAHFGAGFFREVLMLMYQTENVYMDTSGSNSWMKYLPYDLSLTKIFEKALRAGGPDRIVFGTDSSFFPRGFRINVLEDQYAAVRSICPQFCYSDDDVDEIFRSNILKLNKFEPASDI